MPNVNFENIKNYIQLLAKYTDRNRLSNEYGNFLLSLVNLSGCMDKYYQLDENGNYPQLGQEGLEEMRSAYENVFAAQKTYDESFAALGVPDDIFLNDRQELMQDLNTMLGKDLAALSGGIGKDKSLQEILDNARGISLDLSNQNIAVSGANLSSRMPVSYVDDSGKEIKGFFTENSQLDKDREMRELYLKAIEGHPEFERAFTELLDNNWFTVSFGDLSTMNVYLLDQLREKTAEEVAGGFLDHIGPYHPKGTPQDVIERDSQEFNQYRESITKDDTFALRFVEFAKGYAMIENKYNVVLKGAMMSEKDVVEERNAAMSVVADMMGAPDILARSVKMQITRNGETKEGVFMQFAEGCDLSNIKDNSLLNRINGDSMNNPAAFDSIATLQVEDFICGNVDRHGGNMFYQFEETENGPKFKGVVGIDNDCSFGLIPPSSKSDNMRMVGTDHMLVLGEKTANKIMSLTPEMFKVTLRNYKLSNEEVEAAAQRLEKIKEKIAAGKEYFRDHPDEKLKQGYLRIVKEDEWKNYTLDDLAYKPGYREAEEFERASLTNQNYFTTIAILPEMVAIAKYTKEKDAELQAAIEAKNPGLKKAPKIDVKMALGVVMTENNRAGIDDNNRNLNILTAKMSAVNKGFFISSKQFDDVIKATKAVQKLSASAVPEMSSDKLEEIKKAYSTLAAKLDTYLAKKENERKEKEAKEKEVSKTSQKRVAFAEELKKFAAERMDRLTASINVKVHEEELASAELLQETRKNAEICRELLSGMQDGQIKPNITKQYLASIAVNTLLESERVAAPNRSTRPFEQFVQEHGFTKTANLLAGSKAIQDTANRLADEKTIKAFFEQHSEREMVKEIQKELSGKTTAKGTKVPSKEKNIQKSDVKLGGMQ